MASLDPLMNAELTLQFIALGNTPIGTRIDVPFKGVATSSRWDGEWVMEGVDYVTIASDGTGHLDVRGRIGEGEELISYRAIGRMSKDGIIETFTFETACERFVDLNHTMAIAVGRQVKNKLSLEVFAING